MTGIVAHTYPEWWLKLTGQVAHWSTDYSYREAVLSHKYEEWVGKGEQTEGAYQENTKKWISYCELFTQCWRPEQHSGRMFYFGICMRNYHCVEEALRQNWQN